MKLKTTSIFAVLFIVMGTINAQEASPLKGYAAECSPAAGKDSVKAIQSYSLYREFFKQDNYKDAVQHWRFVFKNAPGLRQTTHIDGVKMYEDLIEKADDDKKVALLDTLLYIFDVRMRCFETTGDILGRKALKMLQHKYDDVNTYNTFKKSIEMSGNDAAYYVVQYYTYSAIRAKKELSLSDEVLLKIYGQSLDIIDYNISKDDKYKEKYEKAAEFVSDVMSKTDLLNCENLKPVMQKKYDNNPDDPETWEKIYKQLYFAQCATDELFVEVATRLYEVEPDAEKARILALNKSNNKEYNDAIKYWKDAVDMVEDADKKGEYSLTIAKMYQNKGDYGSARSYANQAAGYKSGWGDPYLLIGDLYRGSGKKCGPGTGFKSQVVTWPAIDMYMKAKSVDPSVASVANRKIADSEKYMPTKEDGFFQGLKEGQSFEIECWINTTTTVRFAPGS